MGRHTIILVLQPHADRTDWYFKRRDWRGDEYRDSLLTRGSLRYAGSRLEPRDLIADLRRIAFELERTYSRTRPEGAPDPPEGDMGGQWPLPGLGGTSWAISHSGSGLDSRPAQR